MVRSSGLIRSACSYVVVVNGVLRKSNYGYGTNNWLEGFYPDNGVYIPKLDTRLPLVNVSGLADCVWERGQP
jgi:hypothetical protein